MKVSRPLEITVPEQDVFVAESVHTLAFKMPERTDSFHKLVYVLQGSVSYRERQREVARPALAGTVLVVPAGMRHSIQDRAASTLLLLCLGPAFLANDTELAHLWRILAEVPERRLMLPRPTRLRMERMWRRAMLEKNHARVGGGVTVRALAAETVVMLARLPATGRGDDSVRRMAAVTREIEETFYDEWTLDRAATRASLSRRRFSDLFRHHTGQTLGNYLNGLRLAHAARLLGAGTHSVMGVMFSCGFNDVSHFYRLFRGRYGAPPRAWLTRNARTQTAATF